MDIFSISKEGIKTKVKVEMFTFPGGEQQVKLNSFNLDECESVVIFHRLVNSNSIMQLLLAVDALHRLTIAKNKIELIIPYFPYARQDRVCVTGEAFGAKIMAQLINNLQCKKVTIWDAHSEVSSALLDNVFNIEQISLIKKCDALMEKLKSGHFTLLSPDAGASKKSINIAQYFEGKTELIQAIKSRDLSNGRILSSEILGDVRDKNILITDDICDGGRTFIELAKKIKENGAKSVTLHVTHGIFSKGIGVFSQLIDEIYTTNSFKSKSDYIEQFTKENQQNTISTKFNIIEI